MKIETLNKELTSDLPVDVEKLAALIDRHELIREALVARGEAIIAYQETFECYTLRVTNDAVVVAEYWVTGDYGLLRRAETLVIEEGYCHTGDARERTEGLPCPLD